MPPEESKIENLIENIKVAVFCLLFLVWVFAFPVCMVGFISAAATGAFRLMAYFGAGLLVWFLAIVWFRKTDPKRVAKAKAREHAKYYEDYSVYSERFGEMCFEHMHYSAGSDLTSPPPALFGGSSSYKLHVCMERADPAQLDEQLLWVNSMFDLISEKMTDRLVGSCEARHSPLSGRPDGFVVTDISLPKERGGEIRVGGSFTGIREVYYGEATVVMGTKGVRCEIEHDDE